MLNPFGIPEFTPVFSGGCVAPCLEEELMYNCSIYPDDDKIYIGIIVLQT